MNGFDSDEGTLGHAWPGSEGQIPLRGAKSSASAKMADYIWPSPDPMQSVGFVFIGKKEEKKRREIIAGIHPPTRRPICFTAVELLLKFN